MVSYNIYIYMVSYVQLGVDVFFQNQQLCTYICTSRVSFYFFFSFKTMKDNFLGCPNWK